VSSRRGEGYTAPEQAYTLLSVVEKGVVTLGLTSCWKKTLTKDDDDDLH